MDCPCITPQDYTIIRIPKSDGKFRIIHNPKPDLRVRLKKILKLLKSHHISFGPYVHGFVRRRSIKTNAESLMVDGDNGKESLKYMIKMDIVNYFHNVRKSHVLEAMEREHLPAWEQELVLKSCFVEIDGKTVLPQGFQTSPFLAALVMKYMGFRLAGLMKRIDNLYITRMAIYADNITFTSESKKILSFHHPVKWILNQSGFDIKYHKFNTKPGRLVVCGVQINDKVGPPRHYWRNLRAKIFNARRDREAGLVPAGFQLRYDDRITLRKDVGILHMPGTVKKKAMTDKTRLALKAAKKNLEEIPFSTWAGQIEFIKSLDPIKGKKLQADFEEMCQWHQHAI